MLEKYIVSYAPDIKWEIITNTNCRSSSFKCVKKGMIFMYYIDKALINSLYDTTFIVCPKLQFSLLYDDAHICQRSTVEIKSKKGKKSKISSMTLISFLPWEIHRTQNRIFMENLIFFIVPKSLDQYTSHNFSTLSPWYIMSLTGKIHADNLFLAVYWN